MHNSAPQHNFLRRIHQNIICNRLCEIERLHFPDILPVRQFFCRSAPARLHRRTARKPFQTVGMVRAFSGVGIFRMTLQKKMPRLRVHQSVHERPVTVDAHTHTGADGNIDCRVAVFCRSPGDFAKHRRIHVRIKSDRDAERL